MGTHDETHEAARCALAPSGQRSLAAWCAVGRGERPYREVVDLDRLRSLVDLPGLVQALHEETDESTDSGMKILQWYGEADRLVGLEVKAGRATAEDAAALQAEVFAVLAKVPGAQFVTNGTFGDPD